MHGLTGLLALLLLPPCPESALPSIAAIAEHYAPPSAAQRARIEALARSAAHGDWPTVQEQAPSAGYVACIRSQSADETLEVWLNPAEPRSGLSWAAIRVGPRSQVTEAILEVPHPIYDRQTLEQGLALFERLPGRAVIIAGAHRCASQETSPCGNGVTSVCGSLQPYRQSDAAHEASGSFHALHVGLSEALSQTQVVSLHGMKRSGASLSTGALDEVTGLSPVARLAESLTRAGVSSLTSCNLGTVAPWSIHLCGGGNVQGRHLNGSANACTLRAERSSHRFIHLEQSPEVRSQIDLVAQAIRDAIGPETRARSSGSALQEKSH